MAVIHIEDIEDARLRPYTQLTNHQLRNKLEPAQGICIVESVVAIKVALAAGKTPVSLVVEEEKLDSIKELLEAWPDSADIYVIPKGSSEKLCGFRLYRGVLCAMRRGGQQSIAELLDTLTHTKERLRLAVVEDLVDVSNTGALFRSAAALGIDGVILSPHAADPLNRRAIRVSCGCVFCVPWARADVWNADFVDFLHRYQIVVAGMALTKSAKPLSDPSLKAYERLALVFGNERSGISHSLLDALDEEIIIPMHAGVDSLNVAASSAVAFWELTKKDDQ